MGKGAVPTFQRAAKAKKQAEKNLTAPLTTSNDPSHHPASLDSVAHATPKIGTGVQMPSGQLLCLHPKPKNHPWHCPLFPVRDMKLQMSHNLSTKLPLQFEHFSSRKFLQRLATDNDDNSVVDSPVWQDESGNVSNDSIVEVMMQKKSKTATAPKCRKVAIAHEDESKSEDDENEIKVQVTNKDDKISSTNSRHQTKKSTKSGSVPHDSNADIENSANKPALCWKDLVQHLCFLISTSALNFWSSMAVKDPKTYPVTTKLAGINLGINLYAGRPCSRSQNQIPAMTMCGQPQPLINLPYAIPLLQYNFYLPWFPPSQLPPPNLTSGLLPVTNVGILPNPVPVKIEVPKIHTWLVYCDMHPDHKGDNFKFHEEGYRHINQLVGDHMDVEKLSR
ncbi:hypothetical protein F5148DRAFT_1308815 [Russula earlei]|uniref:Uncharacterized protein n=1 Tax=Russula earlei TaxID=71964 RepID=A0ACC0TSE2_9AGAM|nr:hypothetical protein F5148DRAFT_1308815 [Russula earlei]